MWRRGLMLLAVAASMATQTSSAGSSRELVLLTDWEASQLQMTESDWDTPPRTRSIPIGPLINLRVPEVSRAQPEPTVETRCPCSLLISFEKNHAAVDMDSLQVKAKKGVFSKSLTERLKPYVRGETLDVNNAKIPAGKFQIEITIADVKGQRTSKSYRFIVYN